MKVIMTGGGTGGLSPLQTRLRKNSPMRKFCLWAPKKDWKKLWFRVTATL
mgnify:CR=1 FL=1